MAMLGSELSSRAAVLAVKHVDCIHNESGLTMNYANSYTINELGRPLSLQREIEISFSLLCPRTIIGVKILCLFSMRTLATIKSYKFSLTSIPRLLVILGGFGADFCFGFNDRPAQYRFTPDRVLLLEGLGVCLK
jgi:hypothetical protein